MGFVTAVQTCFRKYAAFQGRAPRSEFWFFTLFFFILSIVSSILDAVLGLDAAIVSANTLVSVLLLLPIIAVTTRRLHDRDFSGWWQLLYFAVLGVAIAVAAFDIYATYDALIAAGVAGGEHLDAAQKSLDQAEASPLGPFSLFGPMFWVGALLIALATIVLYWVAAVRGTTGDNRFGPDPLADASHPAVMPVSPIQ